MASFKRPFTKCLVPVSLPSLEWAQDCGLVETGLSQRKDSVPHPLPAWVPPRQPAKDLAADDTASRGHRREMLDFLPQDILLPDGQVEVGTHTDREREEEDDRGREKDGDAQMEK